MSREDYIRKRNLQIRDLGREFSRRRRDKHAAFSWEEDWHVSAEAGVHPVSHRKT